MSNISRTSKDHLEREAKIIKALDVQVAEAEQVPSHKDVVAILSGYAVIIVLILVSAVLI